MARYASEGAGPAAAAREFKTMVKTLHAAGIEVILDVVYNHTGEVGPGSYWEEHVIVSGVKWHTMTWRAITTRP